MIAPFAIPLRAWYSSVSRLPMLASSFSHSFGVMSQVPPRSQPPSHWFFHIPFVILNTDPRWMPRSKELGKDISILALDSLLPLIQPKVALALLQIRNYLVPFGAYSQNIFLFLWMQPIFKNWHLWSVANFQPLEASLLVSNKSTELLDCGAAGEHMQVSAQWLRY